jgi:hypothetical protein
MSPNAEEVAGSQPMSKAVPRSPNNSIFNLCCTLSIKFIELLLVAQPTRLELRRHGPKIGPCVQASLAVLSRCMKPEVLSLGLIIP